MKNLIRNRLNTDISGNIIFEDNHLLIAVKPQDILSQADRTGHPDMLTLLKHYIKNRDKKPGNVFMGLVHRLDRPAGGVMVFAKTSKAASRISSQIREGTFKKEYLAIVNGVPENSHYRLQHYLVKDRKMNIVKKSEAGREACLEYDVLKSLQGLSLLKIDLESGRPHQIRVQLSAAGYPLYGDRKYGNCTEQQCRLALWSHSIMFSHPVKNEIIRFVSVPPAEYPWILFDYSYL